MRTPFPLLPRLRAGLALLLAACVLGLGGCGCAGDLAAAPGPLFPEGGGDEPTAGQWATWVVDASQPAFQPRPPPAARGDRALSELEELQAYAAARTPEQLSEVAAWDEGICKRWNELSRGLVAGRSLPPPRAARAYGLLSVAMHDAMVVAWQAKHAWLRARPSAHAGAPPLGGVEPSSPSYVSERACLSAAAREVLRYAFPTPADQATVEALLQSALEADLIAGVAFRSDVEAGAALGAAVGAAVVAWAQSDGADSPDVATRLPSGATYVPAAGPGTGRWTPTSAALPLLPGWGGVRPFVLASGAALACPTPPAWDSAEGAASLQQVYDVSVALTPEQAAIAIHWADGAGTFTPPGHWNEVAVEAAVGDGLREPRMARLLALLNAAQADAFIACWWNKYHHDYVRPVTEVRAQLDAGWAPLIATPPFPSYPSGHSTTSGAASRVLSFLLPGRAAQLEALAGEASQSRLYGGIHFAFDNQAGLDLGRGVADAVILRALHDGAP